MKYLLIPLMCILASSKVTLQSRFSKTQNEGKADNIFFNGTMFLAVAVMFLPFVIMNGVTIDTVIAGIVMGVASVVFQFFYICAFTTGKVSLTVMINNFAMIVPIFVSFLIYGEPFGITKIVGTILALIALCFNVSKDKNDVNAGKSGYNLKWLFYVSFVFLSNAVGAVSQKVYTSTTENLQVFEYVAVSYITAAVISYIILAMMSVKAKAPVVKPKKNVVIIACVVGALLGTFQCVNTYATSVVDGTILYSTYNCATALLVTGIGRVLFKEKLTVKQYIGVFIGVIAIMFICI